VNPLVYVVFCPSGDDGAWWLRAYRYFTDNQIGHCLVIAGIGDAWIVVEATECGLDVAYVADKDLVAEYTAAGCRVLNYTPTEGGRVFFLGLTTCVSAAKMALGIRAAGVITARQLLNWLLANGAVEVVGDEQETFNDILPADNVGAQRSACPIERPQEFAAARGIAGCAAQNSSGERSARSRHAKNGAQSSNPGSRQSASEI